MLAKKSLDTNPTTKTAQRCTLNLAICLCYRGKLAEGRLAIEKLMQETQDVFLRQILEAELKNIVECLANGTCMETNI